MHLPATSEFVYESFAHRNFAGLPYPAMPFRGIGQVSAAAAAISGGISAGVGLATAGIQTWMSSITLSHEADTATTQIVNGLEPKLRDNVNAYLAGPGTCADQAAAMSAYLTAITWLISAAACGNGAYGSAGNRCISDRIGPDGPTDTSGTKFPWATWYYWPIANDPRAAACAAAAKGSDAAEQSAITNIQNLVSGSNVQTVPTSFTSSNALQSGAGATGATNPVTGSAASDLSSLATSLTSGSIQIGSTTVPTIAVVGIGALLILMLAMGRH